jgi:type VII secretion integral membrane protein EccD
VENHDLGRAAVPETVATGLCRITVRAPDKLVTLAVPSDVPWAELLPTILRYAGETVAEDGVEHGGWVLQRLGEEPFDEESTVSRSDVHDGETLHLRPLHDTLPPVHFDDLVDAVAGTVRERGDSWRPALSRQALLGFAALGLLVALVLLARQGVYPPAVGAGLLVLVGAGIASRAGGDLGAGVVLGLGAVALCGVAGYQVVDGELGPRLLIASTAVATSSALTLAAVGAPVFLGLTFAGVLAALGSAAAAYGLPLAHAAGLVDVVALLTAAAVPGLAFRLSGLRLPPLPANADELQEGIEPFPGAPVVQRSGVADGYMTALYAALGLLHTACLSVLALAGGWQNLALAGVLGLLIVVHARGVGGGWHRLAWLVPGAAALALVAYRIGAGLTGTGGLLVVGVVLVLTGVCVITALTVPGRRMLPHWGRAGDVLHTVLAVAVIPLLALDLGLFALLRGIAG